MAKNVHFANSKEALCEILLDHVHVDDEQKLSENNTTYLGFKVESLGQKDDKENINL